MVLDGQRRAVVVVVEPQLHAVGRARGGARWSAPPGRCGRAPAAPRRTSSRGVAGDASARRVAGNASASAAGRSGAGQLVAAQRADRLARLGQPAGGEVVGALERRRRPPGRRRGRGPAAARPRAAAPARDSEWASTSCMLARDAAALGRARPTRRARRATRAARRPAARPRRALRAAARISRMIREPRDDRERAADDRARGSSAERARSAIAAADRRCTAMIAAATGSSRIAADHHRPRDHAPSSRRCPAAARTARRRATRTSRAARAEPPAARQPRRRERHGRRRSGRASDARSAAGRRRQAGPRVGRHAETETTSSVDDRDREPARSGRGGPSAAGRSLLEHHARNGRRARARASSAPGWSRTVSTPGWRAGSTRAPMTRRRCAARCST